MWCCCSRRVWGLPGRNITVLSDKAPIYVSCTVWVQASSPSPYVWTTSVYFRLRSGMAMHLAKIQLLYRLSSFYKAHLLLTCLQDFSKLPWAVHTETLSWSHCQDLNAHHSFGLTFTLRNLTFGVLKYPSTKPFGNNLVFSCFLL